ncbi:MAG TPA: radical SAM protein [Polyangiaceae bacterium]
MSRGTSLHTKLLDLVAPVSPGDELVPGVRLVGASEEAGPRLQLVIDGEPLAIEISPAESSARAFVQTPRLRFAYVASGPAGRARGPEACRAVAERAKRNEEAVLAALEQESAAGATADPRIREVRVDRLLEGAWHEGRTFHTLSPYVGCLVGCRFCYAQSHVALSRQLARRRAVPWGSYVDVRVNAAEVLATELQTIDVRTIKLCPVVSDPYQAVESRYGVTHACLEAIARAARRPAVLVLTRTSLVARDAAILGELRAYVGVSLPTVDDEVRAHFEPRAATIAERLAVLRTLRAAGATTMAVVQPLLPGPVEALADAIAAHCGSASIGVLEGVEGAADDFADPRFRHARKDAWQLEHAQRLREMLLARGVTVWRELPPELG